MYYRQTISVGMVRSMVGVSSSTYFVAGVNQVRQVAVSGQQRKQGDEYEQAAFQWRVIVFKLFETNF